MANLQDDPESINDEDRNLFDQLVDFNNGFDATTDLEGNHGQMSFGGDYGNASVVPRSGSIASTWTWFEGGDNNKVNDYRTLHEEKRNWERRRNTAGNRESVKEGNDKVDGNHQGRDADADEMEYQDDYLYSITAHSEAEIGKDKVDIVTEVSLLQEALSKPLDWTDASARNASLVKDAMLILYKVVAFAEHVGLSGLADSAPLLVDGFRRDDIALSDPVGLSLKVLNGTDAEAIRSIASAIQQNAMLSLGRTHGTVDSGNLALLSFALARCKAEVRYHAVTTSGLYEEHVIRHQQYRNELIRSNTWRQVMASTLEHTIAPEIQDHIFGFLAVAMLPDSIKFVGNCAPDDLLDDIAMPALFLGKPTLEVCTAYLLRGLSPIHLTQPSFSPLSSSRSGNAYAIGVLSNTAATFSTFGRQIEEAIMKSTTTRHIAEFPFKAMSDRLPYPSCLKHHANHIMHLQLAIHLDSSSRYPLKLYQAQDGILDIPKHVPNLKGLMIEVIEKRNASYSPPRYHKRADREKSGGPFTSMSQQLAIIVQHLRSLDKLVERKLKYRVTYGSFTSTRSWKKDSRKEVIPDATGSEPAAAAQMIISHHGHRSMTVMV